MSKRKTILTVGKFLAIFFVLGLLYFVLRSIGFQEILSAIHEARFDTVLAAIGLNFVVFLLWAFRLQLMMNPEDRASILVLFPIYMAGVFGNIITPGARVGGEPIRAYYMGKVLGGERSSHLGILIADKLGNMAVYFGYLLVAVSFVALFVPLRLEFKILLEALVLLIIGAAVSGVLLRHHIGVNSPFMSKLLRFLYDEPILRFARKRFNTYQHFEEWVIGKLDNVFTPIGNAATSPTTLAKVISISSVAWLLFFLANFILFFGFGEPVSFFKVLVIVSIANFCGDLGVSPGGAGFMETAMIALCAAFGVESHTAAAVTLVSRGIFYFCGLGIGGACFVVLALMYGRRKEADEQLPAESEAPPTESEIG